MLPERSTYGASPDNAMRIEVTNDLTIWFSYEQMIAFRFGAEAFRLRLNAKAAGGRSSVVRRHVNFLATLLEGSRCLGRREFGTMWESRVAGALGKAAKAYYH